MEGFITDIETEGKLQYLEDSGYLGSYVSMGGGVLLQHGGYYGTLFSSPLC